jgi:hypothetical protein
MGLKQSEVGTKPASEGVDALADAHARSDADAAATDDGSTLPVASAAAVTELATGGHTFVAPALSVVLLLPPVKPIKLVFGLKM